MVTMSNVSQKIRHLFEALLTVLLFGMQTIFDMGVWMGIMSMPMLPYVWLVLTDRNYTNAFLFNVEFMLFAKNYWVGRIIALIGVVVLLLALAQFIWSQYKGIEFVQSGLYSRIRHPQFTGIIIITIGLTVMIATNGNYYPRSKFQDMNLWLLQVLGYMTIAKYEDWKLLKKLGDNYRQYSQKIPFLFPIKNPKRIPEILFTILIALLIWLILLIFPFYNLIRIT